MSEALPTILFRFASANPHFPDRTHHLLGLQNLSFLSHSCNGYFALLDER